jgi:hypothetical protein
MLNRTVWLVWLQGWDKAPWLIRQVARSWEVNNPGWTIRRLSWSNLQDYAPDVSYIFDPDKDISPQAVSDILRLALLNRHGGVWADATLLCMQPLDPWLEAAVRPAGLWMYHGHGGGMDGRFGPASWFIASEARSPIIARWKQACDDYWRHRRDTQDYFWLDGLFRTLFRTEPAFRDQWKRAPHLYAEAPGQAHAFARGRRMVSAEAGVKRMLEQRPPYVLKLWWKPWEAAFPDPESPACRASNGFHALQLARRGYSWEHRMDDRSTLAFEARMFWANGLHFARRAARTLLRRPRQALARLGARTDLRASAKA